MGESPESILEESQRQYIAGLGESSESVLEESQRQYLAWEESLESVAGFGGELRDGIWLGEELRVST